MFAIVWDAEQEYVQPQEYYKIDEQRDRGAPVVKSVVNCLDNLYSYILFPTIYIFFGTT